MKITNGTIACVGWGSLIWNEEKKHLLPCRGEWRDDGPELPVEFARQSSNGSMTLVICQDVPRTRACWVVLDVPDMQTARERLGKREHEKAPKHWITENIGYWTPSGEAYGHEAATIGAWATAHGFVGVVWTNLPCKFGDEPNVMPSGDQVLGYLKGLDGERRVEAERYVRNAPAQVDTPYRRMIAAKLGWDHVPCDVPACRCKA